MTKQCINKEHYTIKEFAELAGMTTRVLRHYDKIGIFHPDKHGVEFENNYRYYAPQQITKVKMCRVLADIGIPLEIIHSLSRKRTPVKLIKLLRRHKEYVEADIDRLQEIHATIGIFVELLNTGIGVIENDISVRPMTEQRIMMGDINDFSSPAGVHGEFARFCNSMHESNFNPSYPIGGYFENMDTFLSESSQPTRFFSLDPEGQQLKPAGLYLVGYTRGYYGQTNGIPERMAAYAKKHGFVFNGPVYNIYLFDEISVDDPSQYLLQISASVQERRKTSSRLKRTYFK